MPLDWRSGLWAVSLIVLCLAVALAVLKEERMAGPLELTTEEKQELLTLARASLRAQLEGTSPPAIDDRTLSPALREKAACFVTLTKGGALRGCILDDFQAHESVARNVARNVVLAATVDSRFPGVRLDEIGQLTIEISVLGKPYVIPHSPPEQLAAALRPGIDGVTLKTTFGTSTYLPQVWEQLPDVELFLSELCRKQGAPASCWRTNDLLRVDVYQVNHFSEADTS